MDDLLSLLNGDDPSAEQQAQAMASALRRQQAVGQLGVLTGDSVLGRFGGQLIADATRQQEQLTQVPQQRLRMALERQQLQANQADFQQAEQRRQALADPNSLLSQTRAGLAQRFGMKVPAGTPGNQLDDKELGLAERAFQAEEGRKLRQSLASQRAKTSASMVGSIDPAALDQVATVFAQTGVLPPLGANANAGALKIAIINRAAELFPDSNFVSNKAGYGADKASLQKLQVQADAVNAFEGTALKNLDTFLGQARKVVDVGSPLFNAPARKFSQAVAGNPEMAAFNASRQVAVQEIAKVLSGSMGNQAVSDSARHEAASLLSPDASLAQIERAAQILKQDMENRKAAVDAQLAEVRGRIGGGGGQKKQASSAPAAAPAVVERRKAPDGRIVEKLSDGTLRLAK